MRDATQTQLGTELRQVEQRIASTLATYSGEIHRNRKLEMVNFAMLDQLAKVFFTYMPPLGADALPAAVAAGKDRYTRYLRSVGMGLANGSKESAQKLSETL